eukprot:5384791-Prymnesium_polylepis.1
MSAAPDSGPELRIAKSHTITPTRACPPTTPRHSPPLTISCESLRSPPQERPDSSERALREMRLGDSSSAAQTRLF